LVSWDISSGSPGDFGFDWLVHGGSGWRRRPPFIMGATFRQILLLFAIFNPDKFRLILLGLVMPRRFLLAAAVTAAFLVGESIATEEASLVTLSNSWQEGQPVPSDILVFHESEGCLALTTDTVVVFAEITNYALLQEVIFSP